MSSGTFAQSQQQSRSVRYTTFHASFPPYNLVDCKRKHVNLVALDTSGTFPSLAAHDYTLSMSSSHCGLGMKAGGEGDANSPPMRTTYTHCHLVLVHAHAHTQTFPKKEKREVTLQRKSGKKTCREFVVFNAPTLLLSLSR